MDSGSSLESPVCSVRASVMMYNQTEKRWYPCSGNGISRVCIYQHPQNRSFRVVGRKNDTQELSVHCSIVRGLIYNEATATFHQWRHSGSVYGLNFLSQEEAQNFSLWMNKCLDYVCGRIAWPCESHVKELRVAESAANQLSKLHLDNSSSAVHQQPDINQNIHSSEMQATRTPYQSSSSQMTKNKVTLNPRKEEKSPQQAQAAEIVTQPKGKESTQQNFSDELKRCLQTRVQTTNNPTEVQNQVQSTIQPQDSSSDYSSETAGEVCEVSKMQQMQKALRQELLVFQADFLSQIREIVRSEIRNSRLSSDSFH
ncbi:Oidioi.mRNA.OKI2018_I69.XSR.g16737.t1.cds [Oikopleura dioica]|uniref:Oidioi.mRNA.OKI2018_I69.XSR.g16737.t1.cds n=1 Tax=Oikopleura dioica TaxID=34765 RepID=A0ABN7SM85_OIKDI|nr:Oidioi.mRNA.OKI2018_I69.XSR.g16737.t1.cds [Oikopleura dioica]